MTLGNAYLLFDLADKKYLVSLFLLVYYLEKKKMKIVLVDHCIGLIFLVLKDQSI